jgi:hypothetical protein
MKSLTPTYWPSSNGKDVTWVKQHYTDPSAFIKSHRFVTCPSARGHSDTVDPGSYKMRLYDSGPLDERV